MLWAPVPLKFTVLGKVDVTFSVPVVTVIVLAIPNTEVADNCNEVPFNVTLYKFAVPDNTDVPLKVAVPADAESVPTTFNKVKMEKLEAVVIVPFIWSVLNAIVPVPLMVFEVPLIRTVPALAEKEPDTDKLLLIIKEVLVVAEPLTVRSFKIIFVPEIVLVAPVIVIKPPEACVNWPEPLVDRFPETLSVVPDAAVIPEAVKLILLKFSVPDPLIPVEGPLKVIELVLPANVPLFTQFPPTV